jgi:hypothetical protein
VEEVADREGGPGQNDEDAPPLEPCAHCGRADGSVFQMTDLRHANPLDPHGGAMPSLFLHEDCVQPYYAAHPHGQGSASASVPFMLPQEMRRRLRICGYSDQEIAQLTPQRAREILAAQGWTP